MKMAKKTTATKTFEIEYKYKTDTKGTWKYVTTAPEGERRSGADTIYLLKADYPTKPCDVVKAVFTLS